MESKYLSKLKTQRVREKNLNAQCSKERKKKQKKLPVKEDIGGESTAKPVFQIKTQKKKKKTMNADIRKQTMEMQREIDVVAVIHGGDGGGGDGGGRN